MHEAVFFKEPPKKIWIISLLRLFLRGHYPNDADYEDEDSEDIGIYESVSMEGW